MCCHLTQMYAAKPRYMDSPRAWHPPSLIRDHCPPFRPTLPRMFEACPSPVLAIADMYWWKQKVLEDSTEELWCAAGYTYSSQLAAEANQQKKQKTFEEMVPEEYRAYSKVFSEQESERLPEHKPYDHTIDLKLDAPETIRSKVYPMPVNEQEELDKFLAEHLRKGYITPSKLPMASPVFFVKKKDGKLRLVQDYRKLNDITIKNWYPLPLASDIINRLKQSKYFTKFDVTERTDFFIFPYHPLFNYILR